MLWHSYTYHRKTFSKQFFDDKNGKNVVQVNFFNIAWKINIFTSETSFRLIPLWKAFRLSNFCTIFPHTKILLFYLFFRVKTQKNIGSGKVSGYWRSRKDFWFTNLFNLIPLWKELRILSYPSLENILT